MVHPACESDEVLLKACQLTFLRRSGPGGQHRNKCETGVVVEHRPTGFRGQASERRSQADNRRLALFRLRLKLATDFREPVPPDTPPSALWLGRARDGQLSISEAHRDFPSLLAEALDRLAIDGYHLDPVASGLLVSTTQLVKLLKQHRPALETVNGVRQVRGLGLLK